MTRKRRKHSSQFKAKVALEAVKGVKTLSELSSLYKEHLSYCTSRSGFDHRVGLGDWRR